MWWNSIAYQTNRTWNCSCKLKSVEMLRAHLRLCKYIPPLFYCIHASTIFIVFTPSTQARIVFHWFPKRLDNLLNIFSPSVTLYFMGEFSEWVILNGNRETTLSPMHLQLSHVGIVIVILFLQHIDTCAQRAYMHCADDVWSTAYPK